MNFIYTFPYLLNNRYLIIREIGKGGMGIVFEATDQNTSTPVAIKILNPQNAPESNAVARFYREIQACQALSHRNIVPIYDVGEHNGVPYYVMPFILGTSLETLLQFQQEKISVRLAVHIAFQIALALGHAHQRGVIHRDVKPSNIMITNEVVLLTDFGLARPEWAAKMTATGNILGTPAYMSPEQIQGMSYLDGRSDIYSLGVCLYEMLTGKPPFRGNNLAEIFDQILKQNPLSPHQLFPEKIPQSLSYITQKAMSKSVEDRYQSAEEMAEQLRRFLRDLPITISTPKILLPYIKKNCRHWIAVIIFVISLLSTIFICSMVEKKYRQLQIEEYKEQQNYNHPNLLYYIRPYFDVYDTIYPIQFQKIKQEEKSSSRDQQKRHRRNSAQNPNLFEIPRLPPISPQEKK